MTQPTLTQPTRPIAWHSTLFCTPATRRRPPKRDKPSRESPRIYWFVVLGVFPGGLTVQRLTRVTGPYRSERAANHHVPALPGCTVVAAGDPVSALSQAIARARSA